LVGFAGGSEVIEAGSTNKGIKGGEDSAELVDSELGGLGAV